MLQRPAFLNQIITDVFKRHKAVTINFGFLFFSRAIVGLIAIVSLKLLNKVFQPTELGIYASILSLQEFVIAVVDMGVTSTLTRIGSEYLLRDELLAHAFFTKVKRRRDRWGLILSCAGIFFSPIVSWILFGKMTFWFPVALSLCLFIPLKYVSATYIGILSAQRKFFHIGMASIIQAGILCSGLICLLLSKESGIPMAIGIHILASIGYFVYSKVQTSDRYYNVKNYNELLKEHISEIKRVSDSRAVIGVTNALDQPIGYTMLNHLSSSYEAGIYYCAYSIVRIVQLFTETVSAVILPHVARLTENTEGIHLYMKKILRLIPFGICAGIVFALVMPIAVRIFLEPKYQQALPVAWILLIAILPGTILNPLVLVIFPLKLEKLQMYSSILVFAVIVAIRTFLVPAFGAKGIAWSLVIGKAVAWTMLLLSIRYGLNKIERNNHDSA